MADDKRNTPGGRRKRPAPTIDLSATEVASAESPPSQAMDEEPSPAADEKMDATSSGSPPGKRPILIALLAGGIGGVAAVLGGLWLAGVLPPRQTPDDLAARIAALEAQVKTAKSDNNQPIADLTTRIGKLEQAASKPTAVTSDPALAERLAAVENAMKALGVTLAALNRRTEDSAAAIAAARDRADAAAKATEALQTKLDAVEQSARTAQANIAQNSGVDTVARRALAAAALRDAVVRGAPYEAELAIVRQLGADAQGVASLESFAATGVPTEAALSHELNALLPQMIKVSGADTSKATGFFERLQANAGKLVRIRPVGAPAGDDPSAVLARIEMKAAHNDLTGAAAELDKLPPQTSALADGWRKTLAARKAALAAARKLAADSAAAAGSP
jgi:hypothetical protein